VELAGAARLELVSGVAQLRPEDAMFEAMLRGWRAQQTARGLREDTMVEREQLIRRFLEFTKARSTALFQLASELPAAILARLLGIHISVAVKWQQASSGDWTKYAAEVTRRTNNKTGPDPLQKP
jgi:hypothetical protein